MSLMRVGGFLSYCNCFGPQPASWVAACGWHTMQQPVRKRQSSPGRSWPLDRSTGPLLQDTPCRICLLGLPSVWVGYSCVSAWSTQHVSERSVSLLASSTRKWSLGSMPVSLTCGALLMVLLLAPIFWACWALVSMSPAHVQRLPGQFQSCKSANNVWTRYDLIFSSLEFPLHSAPWIEGFEKKGWEWMCF